MIFNSCFKERGFSFSTRKDDKMIPAYLIVSVELHVVTEVNLMKIVCDSLNGLKHEYGAR